MVGRKKIEQKNCFSDFPISSAPEPQVSMEHVILGKWWISVHIFFEKFGK